MGVLRAEKCSRRERDEDVGVARAQGDLSSRLVMKRRRKNIVI